MTLMDMFRRNSLAMVGLLMLAMFSFVALPMIQQYLQKSGPGMQDPVLASFNGIPLTASRVQTFTQQHNATVRYLNKLAQETIRRGGSPQVPGFQFDQQSGEIRNLGINDQPSESASIRTLQFAAEAQDQGFELDDTSLGFWMERFTDGKISERDMYGLLRRETSNRMGQLQLFDMLRKQLLYQLYARGATASVANGQFPVQSPLDHWQNFLKLNQNATVTAYGVLVSDFVEQTDSDPSESEIQSVYEEGKDRFANDQSPEPGFRRADTAQFEYVMADLQSFRDAEVAKLSDDEIRAEYEKRKAGGAFQLPVETENEGETENEAAPEEKPEEKSTTTEESAPAEESKESETTPEMKPETEANSDPKPADEEPAKKAEMKEEAAEEPAAKKEEPAAKKADSEKTSEEKPAEEKSAEDKEKQADEKEETAKEETKSSGQTDAEKKQVEDFAKELEEAGKLPETEKTSGSGDAKPAEGDQSSRSESNGIRLVAMQSDKATEAEIETASDKPADGNDAPESNEKKSDEAPPETDEAAEKTDSQPESQPEPQFRPFEEVRDQVAQSMVEGKARVALDQAITRVRNVMKQYRSERAIYDGGANESAEEPTRPDLKKLADELGLTHRVIGPFDQVQIADEPIANSFEAGSGFNQRGVPFTAMMYGVPGRLPKQVTFREIATVDLEQQRTYLTWKTEEKDAYTPELEEVRDEVVQAIRFAKARELAQQTAEGIAEKVNAGTPLADLVEEDRKDNLFEDVGPFTWLNMVGFGSVTMGNVPELDSVGNDFMKAVFTGDSEKATTAPNAPQRVYYVIKVNEVTPPVDELKGMFKQPQQRIMATFMSDGSANKAIQGFYDTIDDRTGFQVNEVE